MSTDGTDGSEITFRNDLRAHLNALERKLVEKADELKSSGKVNDMEMERIADTQEKVKKYYVQLKQEIKHSEGEFAKIQAQIENYRMRRLQLEEEMKRNEECYNKLLRSVPMVQNSDGSLSEQSTEFPNDKAAMQRKLSNNSGNEASDGDAKKLFNLSGKNSYLYSKMMNRKINIENSNSKSFLNTNKLQNPPHLMPKLDSVKHLKDRFSAPVNLCCCGSISCARNCVVSKNLKLDMQSQHQLLQNIAPHCTENIGRTLGDKCIKALSSLRGSSLCGEEKA